MPRYYFHLTDGKQVLNNHKGIDLSGKCRRSRRCDGARTRPQTRRGHAGLELDRLIRHDRGPAWAQG